MEPALPEKSRPPVPVQITVLRAHDLKGAKGDLALTYLRSEFNNTLLGDSPKLETSTQHPTEYNFTTSFDVGPDSPHSLDDVAHKPVILTVFEILPKEKKQKEEKALVLGQTVVDLVLLLKGECNFVDTLPLYPAPGSPLETIHPDAKPSLEVAISVPEPLLSEAEINNGNILSVTLEAVYSPPESWNTAGPQFNYLMCLQKPAGGEHPLVFSNGILKNGGEMEPIPRPKKWPISNLSAPGAQNIPESTILGGAYEEENGEMNRKEDREFRIDAETNKKRVTWDIERRCYLEPSNVLSLQKRIAECRYWPLEITRVPLNTSPKGKPGKTEKVDEDGQISFHGVAYVNMVPLLYPGVRQLRGAFRIYPYIESEVFEKTKCQSSVMRDIVRQTNMTSRMGQAPTGALSPPTKQAPSRATREEKGGKDKDSGRKMSSMSKHSDLEDVESTSATASVPQNVEGQQYSESGTYVLLEMSLENPLVPKRLPEEMAIKVKDLIPPRPQLPQRTAGAQKAVEDYQSQVVSISKAILKEYHSRFGQSGTEGQAVDKQTMEEQKCQMTYELNCSGKFFAFKEQLKHSVVKIVREKYLKKIAFDDPVQLQEFLDDLYIYLVDQMHESLNKSLFANKEEPPPPALTDSEQLLCFAKEAEIIEDFSLAEMYYQERLAHDRLHIDHWLDYGSFKLLTGDHIKAQECFREALAINRDHIPSLLLCGITAVLLDHYEDAEVFFEDATCVDPSSILAWTMLGLFYEIQGNDITMEMAFSEGAKRYNAQQAAARSGGSKGSRRTVLGEAVVKGADAKAGADVINENPSNSPQSRPETASHSSRGTEEKTVLTFPKSISLSQKGAGTSTRITSTTRTKPRSIFMQTAEFLSRVNATQFVQRALAHELLSKDGGPSCKYYLMCAQMHLRKKDFDETSKNLQDASNIDPQNPDVWALKGHLNFLSGKKNEARECYEHSLSLVADASDMQPIYLRLGSIYLEEGEYEKAKKIYLQACRRFLTCQSWLGVGIACYRLGELDEADDALSQANALNNRTAEVWGYLTLVCLKSGRILEAEQSYKYTRKFNLQDQALLLEIHEMQEEVGAGDPSF
ncbi:cilia- and flagella-associated protein 70 [Discoglossus pictus]